ncbi:WXG100 family type VII secretion target [Nonomuraea sp. NPDC050790]|uniref:WXG100 family type VII secretion target n=1 Tax=Nonomuraea sp. NPDC050790 TaxID=3364371 RepID=UPI0037991492
MATDLSADHPIRPGAGAPFSVNDDGRSVAGIKFFIMSLDPGLIQRAASSYLAAADRLTSMNEALVSGSIAMAKVWEGPSSVESQQSLRTLHATIRELAAKFTAVGRPLEELGRRLQDHREFVENKSEAWSDNGSTWDDSIPGWYETMNKGTEWGSADELAGQHLRLLNDDLRKVYDQLPVSIHRVVPDLKLPEPVMPKMPPIADPGDHRVDPGALNAPTGGLQSPGLDGVGAIPPIDPALSGLPGSALTADGRYPGSGTFPDMNGADPRHPDGTLPDLGNEDGTGPDGVDPDGALPDAAGLPGTGAGMPGTGGAQNPPGSQTTLEDFQRPADWNLNGSTPVPNTSSSLPAMGNGPGANVMTGSAGVPLNARPASAGGTGMPFMPMAGAGTKPGETEDRENSTWLHEDDDIWGGDTDETVPGRIG